MNNDENIINENLISAIKAFLQELDDNGWELNDDGDIVDKKSKRLILDIIHGVNNE